MDAPYVMSADISQCCRKRIEEVFGGSKLRQESLK
jgi:hypothetical protein